MELVFVGIVFVLLLLTRWAGDSTEPMAEAAIAQHNPFACAGSLVGIVLFGCLGIVMCFVALAEINDAGGGVALLRTLVGAP